MVPLREDGRFKQNLKMLIKSQLKRSGGDEELNLVA